MDRHARIDVFEVAARRLAVQRLKEDPHRVQEALGVVGRWREQADGPSRCDPCWREWETLLRQGVGVVEREVGAATDHAATLRSVSRLGRFLSHAERAALLKQAREAA